MKHKHRAPSQFVSRIQLWSREFIEIYSGPHIYFPLGKQRLEI
jgi:hypothetical protein